MGFRFSRQLHPIFDAASEALKDESQIVFGRVDCDKESAICKEFQVNKVCFKRFKSIVPSSKNPRTIICCGIFHHNKKNDLVSNNSIISPW